MCCASWSKPYRMCRASWSKPYRMCCASWSKPYRMCCTSWSKPYRMCCASWSKPYRMILFTVTQDRYSVLVSICISILYSCEGSLLYSVFLFTNITHKYCHHSNEGHRIKCCHNLSRVMSHQIFNLQQIFINRNIYGHCFVCITDLKIIQTIASS